jgi:transcriptional regulator with XRE-family HTH domain
MKYQREKAKLSHKELADIIGVSINQVVCMESCVRIPSKEMLDTLISFFDVPTDYFGLKSFSGSIDNTPSHLSPQDERLMEAKKKLLKQKRSLRLMMKKAGFPFNCTGLHYMAEAIDESIPDTCKYINGELAMPFDTVRKTRSWFVALNN